MHRGREPVRALAVAGAFAAMLAMPSAVEAAEFLATSEPATIIYDAPSAKSRPLFVLGRDTPLEVIVALDGWVKVRDIGGSIGWVEKKGTADRRILAVRVPLAEVRASPDDSAQLVFRAELNVLLEAAEPATSSATTLTPGWIKVRHRDGQVGFVRIAQVFGI